MRTTQKLIKLYNKWRMKYDGQGQWVPTTKKFICERFDQAKRELIKSLFLTCSGLESFGLSCINGEDIPSTLFYSHENQALSNENKSLLVAMGVTHSQFYQIIKVAKAVCVKHKNEVIDFQRNNTNIVYFRKDYIPALKEAK